MGLFDSGSNNSADTGKLDEILERLERVEAKLDQLLAGGASAGSGAPGGDMARLEADVRELLRAGKKIQAIKMWREVTQLGLKESKEAVEALY